jgi:hypothetical protein
MRCAVVVDMVELILAASTGPFWNRAPLEAFGMRQRIVRPSVRRSHNVHIPALVPCQACTIRPNSPHRRLGEQ